ncbi:hypothetical protein FDUTEX481_04750 [Tolypothrix sp. PCC 7601]|nr:hypothetical protein FDUTEX481_04750 [Tolypothrix sp. PCC 7601]
MLSEGVSGIAFQCLSKILSKYYTTILMVISEICHSFCCWSKFFSRRGAEAQRKIFEV